MQAGDINIRPAVVIVITNRTPHGEAGSSHPSLIGHVRKGPIMIVMVKGTSSLLTFERHLDGRGIGEINIGPTIPIIIKQEHSTAHRLRNIFRFRRENMAEADTGLFGYVL